MIALQRIPFERSIEMRAQPLLILLAAAIVSGCGTTRAIDYRTDGPLADAQIQAKGKPLMIFVHPRENSIMAEVTLGSATASGVIEGLTWGLAKGRRLDPRDVDAALNAFVEPLGCSVDPVRQVGNEQVAFEGVYRCPADVDLRAIVAAQRPALRRGEPIRP